MIRDFRDKRTRRLANGVRVAGLPPEIQPKAMRLLRYMAECDDWNELRNPPGNKLHALRGDRKGQYAVWINRQWRIAFTPVMERARMSKSRTITTDDWSADPRDWLPNPHAGEMLWLDFMEPADTATRELASAIDTEPLIIQDVIDGRKRIDAELDLRLARYYGMSEGFFLRLQNGYELLQAKRALNGELDRIVPRAA